MPFLPPRIPPAPDGFLDYWIKAHVILREGAFEWEDGEQPNIGYFQIFGLRCRVGSFTAIVAQAVEDGAVDWDESEVSTRSPSSFSWSFRRNFQPSDGQPEWFWFRSGRVFYTEEGREEGADVAHRVWSE